MKLFKKLACFMGRSNKERHADNNQQETGSNKSKKKSKTHRKQQKRKQQPQNVLKPCIKQADAKPKKRKWKVKFLERTTVYEIEEIVPKPPKKPGNSDKVSKTSVGPMTTTGETTASGSTAVAVEYKTRLNIRYDYLSR